MCGFVFYSGQYIPKEVLDKSLSLILYRGPDNMSSKIIESRNKCVYFGHVRLSIVDEDEKSNQPFVTNNSIIIFNGEIYNYTDFGSYNSDGECIVDLYNKQGETFVRSLDGEFALFLVDNSQRKLIISTDTFACKPLWYEFKEGKLHSGSKKGPEVTEPKQAIAIALSSARKKGMKVGKKK